MTSATDTYLQPLAVPEPLEGKALLSFIQSWVVGITGLPGTMVRPAFQDEAPIAPPDGNVWAALREVGRTYDTFPYIEHVGPGDGSDKLQRQEQLKFIISFYDQGVESYATRYATRMRDGCVISQNANMLQQHNMLLSHTEDLVPAPALFNNRWQYRVDLPLFINRQVDRVYEVLNLLEAQGTIRSSDGYNVPIRVVPNT